MSTKTKVLATVRGEDGSALSVVELADGRYTLRRNLAEVSGAYPATPRGLERCLDAMSIHARSHVAPALWGQPTPATLAFKEPAD